MSSYNSQVEGTVANLPETDHVELTQIGRNLIVMKKSKDDLSLTKFSGPAEIGMFSRQVRFKYGMFDDHMPWGYSALFAGNFRIYKKKVLICHC